MIQSKGVGSRLLDMFNYSALFVIAMAMLFPFIYVVLGSFASFEDFARGGVMLIPQNFSTEAYKLVLANPTILRALGISIFIATIGAFVKLAITTMMAFALGHKKLMFRRFFLILVLIPMLFWPSIIPRFLVVRETGLFDSVWALIIPSAIEVFYLIVMRNFFMSLPEELTESAHLDGANDLQVFLRIALPLSKPILAAIGLFYAVQQWNLYFAAILYIRDPLKWPIQVLLRQTLLLGEGAEVDVVAPSFAIQMATIVVATLPIIIIYPFLQKYFIKGVLTGAIKG